MFWEVACQNRGMRANYVPFLAVLAVSAAVGAPLSSPDAAEKGAPPAPPSLRSDVTALEGYVRPKPILPTTLDDYELRELDVRKEVVFHLGERTVVTRVPVLVYVPVEPASRKEALGLLSEARALLLTLAARSEPVGAHDLAALRDLVERSTEALERKPEPAKDPAPAPAPEGSGAAPVPPAPAPAPSSPTETNRSNADH